MIRANPGTGQKLRVLDLFSGVGGGTLGLEGTGGFEVMAFVECGRLQRRLLAVRWPGIRIIPTIQRAVDVAGGLDVDVVVGGDPCPIRSRASNIHGTDAADLSGYLLAVVGQCRPRWVVRENVPAPDDVDFFAGLECLGYRAVVLRTEASSFTAQTRQRDFVVGASQATGNSIERFILHFEDGSGALTTRLGTKQVIPALTTHRTRYDSRDCYIWEPGRGMRILDGDERDRFTGFPSGWTAGLSEAARALLCGNAIVPAVMAEIGRAILDAEGVT